MAQEKFYNGNWVSSTMMPSLNTSPGKNILADVFSLIVSNQTLPHFHILLTLQCYPLQRQLIHRFHTGLNIFWSRENYSSFHAIRTHTDHQDQLAESIVVVQTFKAAPPVGKWMHVIKISEHPGSFFCQSFRWKGLLSTP